MACLIIKGMDEKDRRSRMTNSTVNAPAKKDGCGGSFTWGSTTEVTWYDPVGIGGMTKVSTARSEDPVIIPNGVAEKPKINNLKHFPALGSASAAPAVMKVAWGPNAIRTQAPPVHVTPQSSQRGSLTAIISGTSRTVTITKEEWKLIQKHRKLKKDPVATAEPAAVAPKATAMVKSKSAPVVRAAPEVPANVQEAMRTGVAFDAQHPRHIFARKPHTNADAVAKQELALQPSIDWSGSGNLAFQKELIHVAAQNPAHLSAFVNPRPAPTLLELLKVQPSPVWKNIPSKQQFASARPNFGKPRVVMQRKC